MKLTYLLGVLAAVVVVYGLWRERIEFVSAGLIALVIAAFGARMYGWFRLRKERESVEIEGTLLPPDGVTPEQDTGNERRSPSAPQ